MIGPELAAAIFGLATALSWGTGDFSGGLATKRTSVFAVAALAHGIGLILIVLVALLAEPLPAIEGLLWGGMAGLSGALGLAGLYYALAVGQMGVAAPIAAVIGTITPVAVGALSEGLPAPLKLVGFALAVPGIWFAARAPGAAAGRRAGVGVAALAGLGLGGFGTLIAQAGAYGTFWPLTASRLVSFTLMLLILRRRKRGWQPTGGALPYIVVAGALDVVGNVCFVLATQAGRLDVAAVLAAMSTAVTVLLARLILKERLSRGQTWGMIVILTAIPLIAV